MDKAYESGEPVNMPGAPQTCAYCDKAIVKQPGTDRYRSTEPNIAVDRMACDVAPDRHHRPAEQAAMRRITPHMPPTEPQFRTGHPS